MALRYVYFDVDDPRKDRATIQLWDGDDLLGAIFLRKQSHLPDDPDPHTPCWQVAGIDVIEKFRRKGFGTKLYEEAARQADRQGMTLCSDTAEDVSNEALSFWEKQVRKGRAYWEVPGPAEREGHNYDYGRFVLKRSSSPSLSGQKPKAPRGWKDYWRPGELAYFQYHCLESHQSCDAEIWYRSEQPVIVLRIVERGGFRTFRERQDAGMARLYKVRFLDGFEYDVFEDELMISERYYDPEFHPGERP